MSGRCFFPNGDVDNLSFPCNPNSSQSSCCVRGESCLSSGYCYGPTGTIYRASCTDPSFRSRECASLCVNSK